jgi:hypothetical protein
MKKVITLVLAIALVLTSVVAIAETVEAPAAPKGTPNINSFAKMTTKYNEGAGYITITLKGGKVDRLLVKWAEKGAEPEELAIDENGVATALTWGHKYMPGTEQKLGTSTIKDTVQKDWVYDHYDVETSEDVYKYVTVSQKSGDRTNPAYFVETTTYEHKDEYWDLFTDKEWDEIVYDYMANYPADDYIIVRPTQAYVEKEGKDYFGNPTTVKVYLDRVNPGYIQGVSVKTDVNKKLGTVIATPAQAAFLTVQGEWAVYYNRAGKIVGIEYFDGQF